MAALAPMLRDIRRAGRIDYRSTRLQTPRCLSDDPAKRLACVALIVGACLRMDENSDCANQPMLPVMRGDDCDALYLLLVVFYEAGMLSQRRRYSPSR